MANESSGDKAGTTAGRQQEDEAATLGDKVRDTAGALHKAKELATATANNISEAARA